MTKSASELVTHPTNDSINDIVENQVVTYKRKGYGIIMAGIITFTYFFILTELVRSYYPYYKSLFTSDN